MNYEGKSPWPRAGNGAGGMSQDSLLRDGLRAAPRLDGAQGCGLGDRLQPEAPLSGLEGPPAALESWLWQGPAIWCPEAT